MVKKIQIAFVCILLALAIFLMVAQLLKGSFGGAFIGFSIFSIFGYLVTFHRDEL